MKRILLTLFLATASVAAAFAQGKVSLGNDSNHYFVLGATLPADASLGGGQSTTNGNTPSGTVGAIPSSPLPSGVYLAVVLYGGTNSINLTPQYSEVITGVFWLEPGRMVNRAVVLTNMPGGVTDYFNIYLYDNAYATPADSLAAGSYYGESGIFTARPGSSITYPVLTPGGAAQSTWAPANLVISVSPTGTNPPSITSQPQDRTVYAYDNAQFSVGVNGNSNYFSYQWSFNGTNLLGNTSRTLIVSNVTPSALGSYAVTVTNRFGAVTSSNALLSMYPSLITNFTGAATYWGKESTLSVVAWGSGPLSYQWYKDGVAIPDATNADLTFTNIQTSDAGQYSVVVSNPFGSTTNPPAPVLVSPAGVSQGVYAGIKIDGVVGYPYLIQGTTNLADPNAWVTLTNLILGQPIQIWVDTNVDVSANPRHSYRVLPGQ